MLMDELLYKVRMLVSSYTMLYPGWATESLKSQTDVFSVKVNVLT